MITRRWARRGTRPSAPADQRTMWAYIFGAICPSKGKGADLVLPYCDTEAMQDHLAEISQAVGPGACCAHPRSGWLACHAEAQGSRQHDADVPAAMVPRTQPGRKRLAVHPGQLLIEPGLQRLRRYCRRMLLCLEQARRSTLENHVHRNDRMGA